MKNKKVIFLCGLIGSGKTTYALNNYSHFTDLDSMHNYARKSDQIKWTKELLKKNDIVCHITTLPTEEELLSFKNVKKEFIWVNTSLEQCKTNILIRNRERDINNIANVLNSNAEYLKTMELSKINFKKIDVFRR